MSSRAFAVCVVAAVVVGAAAGCWRSPPEPVDLEVRVVTAATLSGRWERAAEEGLGRIAQELDAGVGRLRAEDDEARRRVLAELGRNGVQLVFCVGSGFEAVLYTEASRFPGTHFVMLPGGARGSNVAGIRFLTNGVGYLAGAVAVEVAELGRVGILRGAGGPWLEDLERGFIDGVVARDRGADPPTAEGVEGVWRLREEGVTVALYAADMVEPQLVAAAHDADLLLIATDPSLLQSEPDQVVAAVDVGVAEAMVRVAREVRDQTFTGRVYAFDLGSGVLDLIVSSTLPVDTRVQMRRALENARSEVTAGYVEIENLGM